MFDEDFWTPLRQSLLSGIQSVHGSLRLGFGTFFGTGVSCGGLEDSGGLGTGRYSTIESYYSGIGVPGVKFETPTAQAIEQVTQLLDSDAMAQGDATIVLITDGNPDFCNDGVDDCAADATIYRLQQAAASGYHTEVFGVGGLYSEEYLDFFAQAGQGQSPNWDDGLDVTEFVGAIHAPCASISADWLDIWTESGATGYNPIGSYSSAVSSISAHVSTDPATVGTMVATYLQDQVSCVLSLEGETIGAGEESSFNAWLGGNLLESSDWQRVSDTQLELLETACEEYQNDTSALPFLERCE
jgi:hypothetical protein